MTKGRDLDLSTVTLAGTEEAKSNLDDGPEAGSLWAW